MDMREIESQDVEEVEMGKAESVLRIIDGSEVS